MEQEPLDLNEMEAGVMVAADALDKAENDENQFNLVFPSYTLCFLKHEKKTHVESVKEVVWKLKTKKIACFADELDQICETYVWLLNRGYSADVKITRSFGRFFFDGLLSMALSWLAMRTKMVELTR